MEANQTLGFAHFLSQSDSIAKLIFIVLLLMSVATWYLIIAKSLQALVQRRRTARFLPTFWNAPSLNAVERHLEDQHPDEPFSHLAYHAIVSSRHHARHGVNRLDEAGTASEFLTRSMRRVIDEDGLRVGAKAP